MGKTPSMGFREWTMEDFNDIRLPENCSGFDVLVAVAGRAFFLSQKEEEDNKKMMADEDSNNLPRISLRSGESSQMNSGFSVKSNSAGKDPILDSKEKVSPIKQRFSFFGSNSNDGSFSADLKNLHRDHKNPSRNHLKIRSPEIHEDKGYPETPSSSNSKLSKRPGINEDTYGDYQLITKKKKMHPNFKRNLSTNDLPIQTEPLPTELKDCLSSLNGGIAIQNEVLVIQKMLCQSDINRQQNRFSIPLNQLKNEFLTNDEKEHLELRSENGKNVNKLDVKLIDPLRRRWTANFRRWEMRKDANKASVSYVINGTWSEIVSNNQLEEGDVVQLWAVRVDGSLCFALVKLPNA